MNCPNVQVVDVILPTVGRNDGDIMLQIKGGSGNYTVELYDGTPGNQLISTTTTPGMLSLPGLNAGVYRIAVTDNVNKCASIEKVLRLDNKKAACEDPCAKKPNCPCKPDHPCKIDCPPQKLRCELHKVVQPTCKRNGYVAVSVSGGIGPYNITVKGPVHKIISAAKPGVYGTNNLPSGEYWISVTDTAGECCQEEVTLCLVTSPLLVNTTLLCNPSCSNDGSFQVNICEGAGPFKIFVSGPVSLTRFIDEKDPTCPVFDHLPGGNYCVTVIDCHHQVEETGVFLDPKLNNMTLTAAVTSHMYEALNAPFLTCNLSSGSISYTVKNGYYPILAQLLDANDNVLRCVCHTQEDNKLTNTSISGSFTDLLADTYKVKVTDGCDQTQLFYPLDVSIISVTLDITACPIISCGKNNCLTVKATLSPPEAAALIGPLTFTVKYPLPNCSITTNPLPTPLTYTKTVDALTKLNAKKQNDVTVVFDNLPPTQIMFSDPAKCLKTPKQTTSGNPPTTNTIYKGYRIGSDCWPSMGPVTVTVTGMGGCLSAQTPVSLVFKNDLNAWVDSRSIVRPTITAHAGADTLTNTLDLQYLPDAVVIADIDNMMNAVNISIPNPLDFAFLNETIGNGSAVLNIQGGCPPYQVLWASNGGTYKECVESCDPCSVVTQKLTGLGVRGSGLEFYNTLLIPPNNTILIPPPPPWQATRGFGDDSRKVLQSEPEPEPACEFEPMVTPEEGNVRVIVRDATGARFILWFPLTEKPLDCSNRNIQISTTPDSICTEDATGSATFKLTNLVYPLVTFKLSYYGRSYSPGLQREPEPEPCPTSDCQCSSPVTPKPLTVDPKCIKCKPYFTKFVCVTGPKDEQNVHEFTLDELCCGCWSVDIVDCAGCGVSCDFEVPCEGMSDIVLEQPVVTDATCLKNNGEVTVEFTRVCPDVKAWAYLDEHTGQNIYDIFRIEEIPSTSNSVTFRDLPIGDYRLRVEDAVGNKSIAATSKQPYVYFTIIDSVFPLGLVVKEAVVSQPTCGNNGSIGVDIESANYPVVATLYNCNFRSNICLNAKPTSLLAGNEECSCNTLETPPTDMTFYNLGAGCYSLTLKDACNNIHSYDNILLSNCKTPLQVWLPGGSNLPSGTTTLEFKYTGGNGRVLAQLAGPVCLCNVFDTAECGTEQTQSFKETLKDGRYTLTVTDECNQRCTLHFQIGTSSDNGGIGCCPVVPDLKCAKKGPFDVYLVKVGDC